MTQVGGPGKGIAIPVPSPAESGVSAPAQGTVRPEDVRGTARSATQPADTHTANGSPSLPASTITPSDMMIQLTALMSKIAEMSAKTREVELTAEREELKLHHQQRMTDMKVYYEKMDEAKESSVGFFSRMVRAVKAAVAGDIGRAFEEIGKGIVQNPMTFLAVLAAIATPAVAICAPHLLVVCIPLVIHCLSQAAADGELMRGLGELLGMGRDGSETFANVMKWVGVVGGIGSSIVLAVVIAAVGVGAAVFTGGASVKASILLLGALMAATAGLIAVPADVETGVKTHKGVTAQGDAYDKSSRADMSKAESEKTMQAINKEMAMLQEIFDTLQNTINSVMQMLAEQKRGGATAAGAV